MIDLDTELEDALNKRVQYGNLKGRQATAEDFVKGTYATLYPQSPDHLKTVPERDAWVRRHPTYEKAILEKEVRFSEWEAARLKRDILFAVVEKYRTDAATERNMMKASQ